MKVSAKLTVAILLVMCGALALHAAIQASRESEFYDADCARDHRAMGHVLSVTACEIANRSGGDAAVRFLEDVARGRSRVDVRWLPPPVSEGELEPGTSRETIETISQGRDISVSDREGGQIRTYLPLELPGKGRGVLELWETYEEQRSWSRAGLLHVAAIAGAIALLSGGLAFFLGAWIVGRPIRRLIEFARGIGSGRLTDRIDIRPSDEIGDLAAEMNAMADHLAEARARLDEETARRISLVEQLRHAERLATVGQLASGIAHELGTPLSVIGVRAGLIKSGESDGTEARTDAGVIAEQSERMTRIIRQLLDFARPKKPQKSPTDLRALVRGVFSMLAPLAEKRKVALEMEGAEAPRVANVDLGQVEQVLMNIVMNGIQSMPSGGTLRVEIQPQRARPPAPEGSPEAAFLRIDVHDEGEGIPEEIRTHLFEPFFTTKAAGEGTGLGLSVSHGIVHEHGGFIEASNGAPKGTTFSIFLPAEETA